MPSGQAGVAAVANAVEAGEVDANVRFSWIMLGREPRSDKQLLMVYAGILAHSTSMSAADGAHDAAAFGAERPASEQVIDAVRCHAPSVVIAFLKLPKDAVTAAARVFSAEFSQTGLQL